MEIHEPNATLSSSRLVSYGSGGQPVALLFQVGLPYDAPPARAKAALVAAAAAAGGALQSPPPAAFVESYGDSAIVYRLRVWTRSVGQIAVFRDEVYSRVWYELQRQSLSVPFPIRTLHVHHAERERREQERSRVERARQLLSQVDVFADLEPAVVERLAAAAERRHYDRGEVLMREGETGASLFVVERGRVLVSKSGQMVGTGTIQLASLGAGSFFGEMSLLTGEPRSATVAADGPCEVLELSKEALAPVLQEDPKLAEVMSAAVASRQAKTAATVEERRARRQSEARQAVETEESLLDRIRSFFKLGPTDA